MRHSELPPASRVPNPGEMRELIRLLAAKHAQFSASNRQIPIQQFETGVKFVMACGRVDKLSKRSVGDWVTDLNEFAADNKLPRVEDWNVFAAAVIAVDDVLY